jgi:hypothetical protein
MADINITGSGSNATANNYTVKNPVANSTEVSFHSADQAVQICFTNQSTFGTWGLAVPQGGSSTKITLAAAQNTNFCIQPSGTTCQSNTCSQSPRGVQNYNITMGSGMGHEHGQHHAKK